MPCQTDGAEGSQAPTACDATTKIQSRSRFDRGRQEMERRQNKVPHTEQHDFDV